MLVKYSISITYKIFSEFIATVLLRYKKILTLPFEIFLSMNRKLTCFFLFLLSLFTTLQAQQGRDYAKRIEFGRGADYKTCAISPSGAMWLCFSYHNDLFHTDTISTRWLAVPDSVLEGERCYNDFFVVICPDSDKVLVFGKIRDPKRQEKIDNQYWYSPDGGQNWEYHVFAGSEKDIRTACKTRSGYVWIVDDTLYLSDNAGESFRPIRALPSTADLFMSEDNRHGISCQYENGVVITNDNWQTETRIPTPYDQGLIRAENYPGRIWWNFERCYRVYLTDSLYLLYQCADWFLTRRDTIQWQLLPEQGVSSIIANPENGKVVLLKSNHVLQTADFQSYDSLFLANINAPHVLLDVVNGQLYGTYGIPNDSVFCIDLKEGTTKFGAFFTNDQPMWPPEDFAMICIGDSANILDIKGHWEYGEADGRQYVIEKHNGLWGYDENDVLRYDTNKRQWYRLLSTSFLIREIIAYRDEVHPDTQQVVISDGIRHYLVSDKNPSLQAIRFNRPLDSFLRYPLEKMHIETIAFGCGSQSKDKMVFERKGDSLKTSFYSRSRGSVYSYTDTTISYTCSFATKTLDSLLQDLNLHYDTGMTQAMFRFTDEDYEAVFKDPKNYPLAALHQQTLKDTIPKLSDSLLTYILTTGFHNNCTGGNIYEITLINDNKDTLLISMKHHCCSSGVFPYIIPFTINTGKIEFFSTHFPFMQFMGNVMPPEMIGKYLFSNEEVLYKIIRYLTVQNPNMWERYFEDY